MLVSRLKGVELKMAYAKAHTNIAFVKYWGKKNAKLMLPMNNSISLTLDAFYTETCVEFKKSLTKDVFILNGQSQSPAESAKVEKFLTYARLLGKTDLKAEVKSVNHVPTAAGLASSASGMAALAGSCAVALDLPQDAVSLSRMARHGSGSATRSVYGGFAEWQQGTDDASSYAVSLKEDLSDWPLAMIFVLVDGQKKKISSRVGMERTVLTSPFYEGWLKTIEKDLTTTRKAIEEKDFQILGETMEANALKMHATTMGAIPPFTYFAPGTLQAMNIVQQAREEGLFGYFTMDAGPNVKILVERANVKSFLARLTKAFPKENLVVAFPGEGLLLKKEK